MNKHVKDLISEYFKKLQTMIMNAMPAKRQNKHVDEKGQEGGVTNLNESAESKEERSPADIFNEGINKLIDTVFSVKEKMGNNDIVKNCDSIDLSAYIWYISRIRLMKSWKENGLIEYDDEIQQSIDEVIEFAKQNKKQTVVEKVETFDVSLLSTFVGLVQKKLKDLEGFGKGKVFLQEREAIANRLNYLEQILEDGDKLKSCQTDLQVCEVLSPEYSADIKLRIKGIFECYSTIKLAINKYIEVHKLEEQKTKEYAKYLAELYGLEGLNEEELGKISMSCEVDGIDGLFAKSTKIAESPKDVDLLGKISKIFDGIARTPSKKIDTDEIDLSPVIKAIVNDKIFTDALVSDKSLTDEEYQYIFNLLTENIQSLIKKSYLSLGLSIDYENQDEGQSEAAGCATQFLTGWNSVDVNKNQIPNYIVGDKLTAQSQLEVLFTVLAHETKHLLDGLWTFLAKKEAQSDISDDITEFKKIGNISDPKSYVNRIGRFFGTSDLSPTQFKLLGSLSPTALSVSSEYDDEDKLNNLIEEIKRLDYFNSKSEKDARRYGTKMSQMVFALLAKEYANKGMNEQVEALSKMAQNVDKVSMYLPTSEYLMADEKIHEMVMGIEGDLKEVADARSLEFLLSPWGRLIVKERDMHGVQEITKASDNLFKRYVDNLSIQQRKQVFENAVDAGSWRTIEKLKGRFPWLFTTYDMESDKLYEFSQISERHDFDDFSSEDIRRIKGMATVDIDCLKKFIKDKNFRAIGISLDTFNLTEFVVALGGGVFEFEKVSQWLDSFSDEVKHSDVVINMLKNILVGNEKRRIADEYANILEDLLNEIKANKHDLSVVRPSGNELM